MLRLNLSENGYEAKDTYDTYNEYGIYNTYKKVAMGQGSRITMGQGQ